MEALEHGGYGYNTILFFWSRLQLMYLSNAARASIQVQLLMKTVLNTPWTWQSVPPSNHLPAKIWHRIECVGLQPIFDLPTKICKVCSHLSVNAYHPTLTPCTCVAQRFSHRPLLAYHYENALCHCRRGLAERVHNCIGYHKDFHILDKIR